MDKLKKLSDRLFHELNKNVGEQDKKSHLLKAMEEIGEVADLLLRMEGGQRRNKHLPEQELEEKLAEEICHAIIPLIFVAKKEDIDVFSELEKVIEKEIKRWG